MIGHKAQAYFKRQRAPPTPAPATIGVYSLTRTSVSQYGDQSDEPMCAERRYQRAFCVARRASTNEWTTHDAAASSGVLAPPTDRSCRPHERRQTDGQTNKRTNGRTVCNRDVPRPRATRSNIEYMPPNNATHRFLSVFVSSCCFAYRNRERLNDESKNIRSTIARGKYSEARTP